MKDRVGQIWEEPDGSLCLIVRAGRITRWCSETLLHATLLLEDGEESAIVEPPGSPLEARSSWRRVL